MESQPPPMKAPRESLRMSYLRILPKRPLQRTAAAVTLAAPPHIKLLEVDIDCHSGVLGGSSAHVALYSARTSLRWAAWYCFDGWHSGLGISPFWLPMSLALTSVACHYWVMRGSCVIVQNTVLTMRCSGCGCHSARGRWYERGPLALGAFQNALLYLADDPRARAEGFRLDAHVVHHADEEV